MSCGAPEDTDLELSRGEKAESELTQPPQKHAAALARNASSDAGMLRSAVTPEDIRDSGAPVIA